MVYRSFAIGYVTDPCIITVVGNSHAYKHFLLFIDSGGLNADLQATIIKDPFSQPLVTPLFQLGCLLYLESDK